MLYDITQLTPDDTGILDEWYARASNTPTVSRYLGIAGYNTPISMPESDWDGMVFINDEQNGIIKLYFDHEINTATFGIWVIPTHRMTDCARDLMGAALGKLTQLPNMTYLASRVQSTNDHGNNFSKRYLGHPWGCEPNGAYDRVTSEWVAMNHYKSTIADVQQRLRDIS